MTDHTEKLVPPGLADQPLQVRLRREAEVDREIQDGLTSRRLSIAAEARAVATYTFATLVRVAPALALKLRGG